MNELINDTSFLKGCANSFATSLLMSSMPDLNSLSTAIVPQVLVPKKLEEVTVDLDSKPMIS